MNKDAFHILSDIYPEDINFLDERDDFRFLSSVLLSAQTTDKRVNEVTPILFSKYDTVKKLATGEQKTFSPEELIKALKEVITAKAALPPICETEKDKQTDATGGQA